MPWSLKAFIGPLNGLDEQWNLQSKNDLMKISKNWNSDLILLKMYKGIYIMCYLINIIKTIKYSLEKKKVFQNFCRNNILVTK
jgi:hypothetical protein